MYSSKGKIICSIISKWGKHSSLVFLCSAGDLGQFQNLMESKLDQTHILIFHSPWSQN